MATGTRRMLAWLLGGILQVAAKVGRAVESCAVNHPSIGCEAAPPMVPN
jgi:hypothetical protein